MPLICRHNASQIVLQYQDGPALHCAATTRRLFIMLQRIIILIVFSFLGKFISSFIKVPSISLYQLGGAWHHDIDIHRYSQYAICSHGNKEKELYFETSPNIVHINVQLYIDVQTVALYCSLYLATRCTAFVQSFIFPVQFIIGSYWATAACSALSGQQLLFTCPALAGAATITTSYSDQQCVVNTTAPLHT